MVSTPDSLHRSFNRLPYAAFLVLFSFIFILSFRLIPSSEGHGTHRQLGLPACGFLTVTGYPCPSCGITTSFSHFVRGDLYDSLRVQPFGFVLFVVLCGGCIMSIYALIKSIPISHFLDSVVFEKLQVILLTIFILSWGFKILVMGI